MSTLMIIDIEVVARYGGPLEATKLIPTTERAIMEKNSLLVLKPTYITKISIPHGKFHIQSRYSHFRVTSSQGGKVQTFFEPLGDPSYGP